MAEEDILAALRGQDAGAVTGWRPPRSAWETLTDPIKALFGVSGNIAAQLARPFAPAAYERAALAQARALRIGPESDAFERAKALPNLGDVIAEADVVPQALEPAARFAGALVDPTNLIPVSRALKVGSRIGEVAAPLGRALGGQAGASAASRAAQAATAFPFTAAAGLVYAPELAGAAAETGRTLVGALEQGDIGQSTQAMMGFAAQAALGYAVARGAAGELGAARESMFPQRVDPVGGEVAAPAPPVAEVSNVSDAVRAGRVAASAGAPVDASGAATPQARVAAASAVDVGVPGAGRGPLPTAPAEAALPAFPTRVDQPTPAPVVEAPPAGAMPGPVPTPLELAFPRIASDTGIMETIQPGGGLFDAGPAALAGYGDPNAMTPAQTRAAVEAVLAAGGEVRGPLGPVVRKPQIAPEVPGEAIPETAGKETGEPEIVAPAGTEPPPAPLPEHVQAVAREIADNPLAVALDLPEFRRNVAKTYKLSKDEVAQAVDAAKRMRASAEPAAPASPPAPPGKPPDEPPASTAASDGEIPVPRTGFTEAGSGPHTEFRSPSRLPSETPDVTPAGARVLSFTPEVPAERKARPDQPYRPATPLNLAPEVEARWAEQAPGLARQIDALIRRFGGDSRLQDVADRVVDRMLPAWDPTKGKKTLFGFVRDDLSREFTRAKERFAKETSELKEAETAPRGQAPSALGDDFLTQVDDSIEKTPTMRQRASEATDRLDSETNGAYSAARDGRSYKEFANEAGITEGEAQRVYRSLGARVRALADAAGLPVRGDAFNLGEIRVPESGANEVGRRSAEWASQPTDLTPFSGQRDVPAGQRWETFSPEYKSEVKRYLQRLAFGMRTGGERSPLREWVRMLEATGSIPPVKFGKEASIKRQAETVAREVFGQKPGDWFDQDAQTEFMRWLSALEKSEREGLSKAWRPSDTPGLMKATTPSGPMIATVREVVGNRVFEPSDKLWGARGPSEQIAGDEARGVLDRLSHLIKSGDIPSGSLLALPNDLRQFPKIWTEWKDRHLQPLDVAAPGRQGNSTLYRVREVPGAPRHPSATADFLGLQTASELAERGLKEASRVLDHGMALLSAGVRDFATWSKKMLATFGDSVSKWLEELWVRSTDAAEQWAERRSDFTQRLLVAAFHTEPSRLGPAGKVPLDAARKAVQDQAQTAESLAAAEKASKVAPQERFLRGSTAKAIEDELAFVLAGDAPKIDVGKVKPGAESKLYDLGINLNRVGVGDERVKQEQAYLQRVMEVVADRSTPVRTQEVLRQALPLLDQTPGEVIAAVQKKLNDKLTYGEALTIRNLRDILGRDYAAAKQTLFKASEDFASGAIDRAAYDKALADAAAAQAKAAHTSLVAANVGTYGGRLLAFQRIMTSDKPFRNFRDRFIGSAREGLEIKQDAAEQLYKAYEDLASRKIDLADYMTKLHTAAGFTKKDMLIEGIKASMLTLQSPVSAGVSNQLSIRMADQERQLGAHLAPITRKLFGYSEGLRQALGPERANYPMPSVLRSRAAAEAGRENSVLLRDGFGRILRAEPFNPHGGSEMLHQTGAIPGRTGEFIRSILKTLDMMDRHGQNRARASGIYQHAWNEAVKNAKREGTSLDTKDLIQDTLRRADLMKEAADPDTLYTKYGSERGREILAEYAQPLADVARDARRLTFANALDEENQPYFRGLAALGEGIGKAVKGKVWGAMVFPFHRTPTNVAIASLLHTPLGFAQVQKALREGKITPERWERDIMKPIIGTGIMMSVLPLAVGGTITGGGPGDPRQEQLLRETGWQPYSIRVGDQYFSYQRLEPLAALLGFVGDLGDAIRRGDFKDDEGQVRMGKLAQRAAGSLADNLTSKTFLSGLEGLFTAVHDPVRYGERFVKQLSGTLVPNTVGYIPVGSLGRAVDPYIRQTSMWTAPLAKIPILNESLPRQIGSTAAYRERTGTPVERLLSPLQRSEARTDKEALVAAELDRISYVPTKPRTYQDIGGRKIYYTEREQGRVDEAQRRASQDLYRLIRSSSYRDAPESEADPKAVRGAKTKQELVEDFYRKQRAQVQASLRPDLESRLRRGKIGQPTR